MSRTTVLPPRSRRAGLAIAALLALAPVLAACGTDEAAPADADRPTVAIVLPATEEVFWGAWTTSARTQAEALDLDLVLVDTGNDVATMDAAIADLVDQGVDALAVAPVDPEANLAAAQAAIDAGIPVITANRTLATDYGDGGPLLHTGFDDVAIGTAQAALVAQVCADVPSPCRVLLEEGVQGSSPQLARTRGFEDGLATTTGIRLVGRAYNDFDAARAVPVTEQLLAAHDRVDVLVCQGDPECVAAARVVTRAGRAAEIAVVGLGGSIDGVRAVQEGRMYGTVHVSAGEDGATAVRALAAVVRGTTDDLGLETTGARPTLQVPATSLTVADVDEHLGDW
ncbi:sugar ABC transporter substrate-binding protein [Nocardioides bruguierae]|uniref:sugar ABC transporter substrate-binding protein n=1 Tax=Nocardioides bruguierae TaxID=2945102 RepID=UPI00202026F4|nr:sugar ABC transporter substrate-binding protein [Nocardioides bruguierae]MCL8026357.1 sugar ABC transporter substrate-binding protein [Nocardioides bruguierae]